MSITHEERAEIRDMIATSGRDGFPIDAGRKYIPRLLDALEQAESDRDAMRQQLCDLMSESQGVAGLHLNGDLAEWDWLIENEWLSLWDTQEAPRGEGKYAGRLPHDVAGWNPNDEGHG